MEPSTTPLLIPPRPDPKAYQDVMRYPTEEPLGAGSDFTYESDIAPLKKKFFQRVMSDRNLTPEFAATLSSQFSGALNAQAEKDQQLRARDLQYKASIFTLDREREKAARERRQLQDLTPFQAALDAAISDPTRPPTEKENLVGRLGIQYAGLIGESPAAAAAYRSAVGGITTETKPKTTAGAFLSAGGSYDFLKAYEKSIGTPVDVDTEIPFSIFAEGLDVTDAAKKGEKFRLEEFERSRKLTEKRADSLVSDLKGADLLADDPIDKTKRNPNAFASDYDAAVVEGILDMFGTSEEKKIASKADAATKLKLAQRIGGEYRLGKRIPGGTGSTEKPVESLFKK